MTSISINSKSIYIQSGIPGPDDARWTVSYGMLQAHISVAHDAITRGGPWVDEYFARRRAVEASGGDTLAHWKALSHCIARPCLSLLGIFDPTNKYELAPADAIGPWKLAHYCIPWTIFIRIVSDDESMEGGWGGVHASLVAGPHRAPSCNISPMPMEKLLQHLPKSLPHLPASALAVEDEGRRGAQAALHPSLPRRVRVVDDDDGGGGGAGPLFFKPCLQDRELEFEREVEVLARIVGAAGLQQVNTARMAGVVTTDDGTQVLGMLLPWIPGAMPLAAEAAVARVEMHGKWREELRGIISALHEAGIVWGDVNPHNIVIDDRSAAWVVDFGGECNVEFVDEENKETAAGDWQGWQRVFDVWLPTRNTAAAGVSGR